MGKSSPPKPPSPEKTAAAQTGSNIGTAIANSWLGNINQIGPTGNLQYKQTGSYKWTDPFDKKKVYDIPIFTAETSMTPQMQALWDRNMANYQGMADLGGSQINAMQRHLSQPFQLDDVDIGNPRLRTDIGDYGQVTTDYGPADGYSADRQRVEDALMQRMQPYIDQDRDRLRTQLVNQGFRQGSTGYDRAEFELERQIGDKRMAAILAAGDEQARLAGLDAQRAGFQNAAQAQRYSQAMGTTDYYNQIAQQEMSNRMAIQSWLDQRRLQNRNQPINEIVALLSGSQITPPAFNIGAGDRIANTDYAGLSMQNYQQQLQAWQSQQQQKQNMFATILGFGTGMF